VTWEIKHHLIAYFLSKISAKNDQKRVMYIKVSEPNVMNVFYSHDVQSPNMLTETDELWKPISKIKHNDRSNKNVQ